MFNVVYLLNAPPHLSSNQPQIRVKEHRSSVLSPLGVTPPAKFIQQKKPYHDKIHLWTPCGLVPPYGVIFSLADSVNIGRLSRHSQGGRFSLLWDAVWTFGAVVMGPHVRQKAHYRQSRGVVPLFGPWHLAYGHDLHQCLVLLSRETSRETRDGGDDAFGRKSTREKTGQSDI